MGTWSDVRAGDLVLGVLAAAAALGGSAYGVHSAVISATQYEPPSILEPGEVAVAVQTVELEPEPDEPSTSPTTVPLVQPPAVITEPGPVPPSPTAPTDGPATGPAYVPTPVPPRPPDAPPPSPSGKTPPRPRGGIRGLPRIKPPRGPAPPSLGDLGPPAEPGFGPGGPTVAPGEADPEESPDDPYAYVDPETEDPAAEPHGGVVADETDADKPAAPGVDPLAQRALAAYTSGSVGGYGRTSSSGTAACRRKSS